MISPNAHWLISKILKNENATANPAVVDLTVYKTCETNSFQIVRLADQPPFSNQLDLFLKQGESNFSKGRFYQGLLNISGINTK